MACFQTTARREVPVKDFLRYAEPFSIEGGPFAVIVSQHSPQNSKFHAVLRWKGLGSQEPELSAPRSEEGMALPQQQRRL